MDDSGSPNSVSEFTLAEIVEMENIYKEIKGQALGQDFCKDLAMRFSCSSNRAGKFAIITCEQVQNWFKYKHEKLHPENPVSPTALDLVVDLSGSHMLSDEPESSQKPKEEKIWKCSEIIRNDNLNTSERVKDLHELAFEARSVKDYAWKIHPLVLGIASGFCIYTELNKQPYFFGLFQEVRVRFSGFSKEEDEWVNMKRGVRERSIPLEPSECQKVKVGDLVLCFQEREQFALYCDAHIVGIERKPHDLNACRCIFIVRYVYDNSEEEVRFERICCRPVGSNSPDNVDTENQKQVEDTDEDWKLSFLY